MFILLRAVGLFIDRRKNDLEATFFGNKREFRWLIVTNSGQGFLEAHAYSLLVLAGLDVVA